MSWRVAGNGPLPRICGGPVEERTIAGKSSSLIIALIAYVLGARGVAGMSAGIGRTLLFVFLVLAIIFLIVGLVSGPRV